MSVSFKELGGSPIERYGLNGFTARREFLIAWEDRDAFAAEVLGKATSFGGSSWAFYPGKPSVFAVKLRFEPFDPKSPDVQSLTDLTVHLNSYANSFATAVVDYKTVNQQDRDDGPANETGTSLTYRMTFGAEVHTLSQNGWSWVGSPSSPLAADLVVERRIPTTQHELTWSQVVNPPWDTIRGLQGTLNNAEFLGCTAGTLLFEGAEANKLFRADFEAGASAFAWKIRYLFRERSVKHGGQTFGWNHFYRDSPAGWDTLTNGAELVYDSADFSALFQSTSGG